MNNYMEYSWQSYVQKKQPPRVLQRGGCRNERSYALNLPMGCRSDPAITNQKNLCHPLHSGKGIVVQDGAIAAAVYEEIHPMWSKRSGADAGRGGVEGRPRVLYWRRTAPLCSCQILSDVALRGKGSHFPRNAQVISDLSSSRL